MTRNTDHDMPAPAELAGILQMITPDHVHDGPETWTGMLSDIPFRAYEQDGTWIMCIHHEAEVPIQINNSYHDKVMLKEHAALFDYALAVARDPEQFPKDEVLGQSLGLSYVSAIYRSTSDHILSLCSQAPANPALGGMLAKQRLSADRIRRIADRIDMKIRSAGNPTLQAALSQGLETITSH